MNKWCQFYAHVMGFAQLVSFDDKDISTEYTALMSKVMSNGNVELNSRLTNLQMAGRNRKLRNISISIMVQGSAYGTCYG